MAPCGNIPPAGPAAIIELCRSCRVEALEPERIDTGVLCCSNAGMRGHSIVLAWLLNILVLSLVLAVFEVVLEKKNGWGSGLNSLVWGRRMFEGTMISRICEKPYFTVYHVFMFLLVVPTALTAEYAATRLLGICQAAHSAFFGASSACVVTTAGGQRVVPVLFAASTWLALIAVEDFLWFGLNWFYPGSMRALLSGEIWWHQRWVSFGPVKLPRFYLSSVVGSVVLLFASFYF
jgi:hypothetical protein